MAMGAVVSPPDLKAVGSGKVLAFSVRCVTGKPGKEVSTIFRVNHWKTDAEALCEEIKQGKNCLVTGELSQRRFKTKDAVEETTSLVIQTQTIVLLPSAAERTTTAAEANPDSETEESPAPSSLGCNPAAAPSKTDDLS